MYISLSSARSLEGNPGLLWHADLGVAANSRASRVSAGSGKARECINSPGRQGFDNDIPKPLGASWALTATSPVWENLFKPSRSPPISTCGAIGILNTRLQLDKQP
ncbi:hypothetical protein CC2G_002146 [Coprinopsis cinerea AmutBmut pab1-1]|nr:hypothetical protein CC2G_002146 [Coprinopsis cinerea AmutBmut pab1-1]